MAEPPLHLIIGNYNTSSWSLRAWLVLRLARLAFVETRIPLRGPETAERIGRYSPSGKLPVLLAEGVPIWDSLAIAEFIAELEPGIWPLDPIARAEARAISAEVHSGFADLRRLMPMDIVNRFAAPGRLPRGLAADIRRVMSIWEHCRARFAAQGPFLFGAFSITDAMMAPIAARFVTHGVPLAGAVEDYVESVLAWPDMVTWCDAAAAEHTERVAQGSLAVATVTRPGRVLGPEPAVKRPDGSADMAQTSVDGPPAEPTVDAGTDLALREPKRDATTASHIPTAPLADEPAPPRAAASAPVGTAPTVEPELDRLPAAAEAHAASAALSEVIAEPPPPPRRRLFETTPISQSVPSSAPPLAADADQRRDPVAAARSQAPADDHPLPPPRKLGWLRHGVPAEHLDELEKSPGRPLAEGTQVGDGPAAAALDSGSRDGRSPQPAADEPATSGQPRAAEPPRPAAPAIKPIGGGILRRR
jgi:glutathione S-transferase